MRLRDRNAIVMSGLFHAIPAMSQAADEIESLRAHLAAAEAIAIENIALAHKLQAAMKALEEAIDRHPTFVEACDCKDCEAVKSWQQVLRSLKPDGCGQ